MADQPIQLPNGEPLTCIYYFPQWWEPWKSDDDAIRHDFQRLRKMGYNTLLLDHEWSQAIDGDWKWLDRAHRLAKEAGLYIIPWLGTQGWAEIDSTNRAQLFEQWYGLPVTFGKNQDGSQGPPPIYQDAIVYGGAQYAIDYMNRYAAESLLYVNWQGEIRPVISLNVETAWKGCFDDASNRLFSHWLQRHYVSIDALNAAWKTSYPDFLQVNPLDQSIFDYKGQVLGAAAHPQAIEDHVEFRSEMISQTLGLIASLVRSQYSNVLIMAEVPYQYGSQHPDAISYRINFGANPNACDYADIVLFRCVTSLNNQEIQVMRQRQAVTGQKFIFTYRTYSNWDVETNSWAFSQTVENLAVSTAQLASGFGLYTWNEMVDTQLAYSPYAGLDPTWTAERSEKAINLAAAMTKRYLFESQLSFQHCYSDVLSPLADSNIVEKVNVKKCADGDTWRWQPEVAGQDARITMRYDFPKPVQAAYLQVNANDALSVWNSGWAHGSASLWVSTNGIAWTRILDGPTPVGQSAFYSYNGFLPESVLGASSLWLEARMRSEGVSDMAQFLRHSTGNPNNCFRLAVRYQAALPPIKFRSFSLTRDNARHIILDGVKGMNHRLEVSTNLLQWSPMITLPCSHGFIDFLDQQPITPGETVFYRAVIP
jgi:hypothetical protein